MRTKRDAPGWTERCHECDLTQRSCRVVRYEKYAVSYNAVPTSTPCTLEKYRLHLEFQAEISGSIARHCLLLFL